MSDLIERIKKRIYEEQEKEFINNEVAMGDVECSKVIDIIDEESAKEPQECEWKKMHMEEYILHVIILQKKI